MTLTGDEEFVHELREGGWPKRGDTVELPDGSGVCCGYMLHPDLGPVIQVRLGDAGPDAPGEADYYFRAIRELEGGRLQ